MPPVSPEQVQTLHLLINEAVNTATGIAEALHAFGEVDERDPEAEMTIRVRSTKALAVRDALTSLLNSFVDDPS